MQKIYIKNFQAIQEADIEIKKVLVLIGEQASGKSTIAKLIYFFKTLHDDFFNQIYQNNDKKLFDITQDLIIPTRQKFYDFFGSTFHLPEFNLKYYYNVEIDIYIELKLDENRRLYVKFSDNLLNNKFINKIKNIKSNLSRLQDDISLSKPNFQQIITNQDKLKSIQSLSELINDSFQNKHNDTLFIVAGRSSTVSYTELFEKYLFSIIQNQIKENQKLSFLKKEQTIDENLMLQFMERIIKIKGLFKKYGGFEGLLNSFEDEALIDISIIKEIDEKITKILKGKYSHDNYGEKIHINDTQYVHLHNTSSGQQESIRILQDIFLIFLEKSKALRIIEEPEAHLFPVAQKHLIELLALMVNQNEENQLIITTHSPYILTVFNNLLFASRVIEKNPPAEEEVNKIIDKQYWLQAKNFTAYSLGNSEFEDTIYCENILDTKTEMIGQNYLDTVSRMLGNDFNQLYKIHARSFAKKRT